VIVDGSRLEMTPREQTFSKMGDTLEVVTPNAIVLALVNLVTLQALAQLVLIGLSIAYTVWRWKADARKK